MKNKTHWWLSFVRDNVFQGVVIIDATCPTGGAYGLGWAVREAHRLGVNPGGEVRGVQYDREDPTYHKYLELPVGELVPENRLRACGARKLRELVQ